MSELFNYESCGLPNVWLRNGFSVKETPYGELVAIQDLAGLHQAIGLYVVDHKPLLSGAEIRFLRKELDFSQQALLDWLGVSEPTIRNWEAERQPITVAADRMLRLFYREHVKGNVMIRQLVDQISRLERQQAPEPLALEDTLEGWKVAA
jgi:DNA-binding transcriptional regulator YiaG